jgi:hydroxymethylpyrimidine pyrophosphatase-like HAD family hydrolase
MTYRLLALDLDGTLLDPYGALTDAAARLPS